GLTISLTSANAGSVAGMVGAFANVQNLLGAGAGGNTFAFSSSGSLAGDLDGGVGPNNLLDYAGYPTAVTVDLSANSATRVAANVVHLQLLRGSAGNDSLTGTKAGDTAFLASPGSDTVTGLGSGNTLAGTDADSTWNVTATNAGTLTWGANTTTFTGVQNLTGGSGADDFIVNAGAGVIGAVNGGGRDNTPGTAAYTSNQAVSIPAPAPRPATR